MKRGFVGKGWMVLAMVPLVLVACATSHQVIRTYDGEAENKAAIATVMIPGPVNLLRVEGESYHNVFMHGEKEVRFLPGTYTVELEYERLWEPTADDHVIVTSEVVEQQWHVQAGAMYRLKHDTAETLDASQKVAEHFQPWLVEVKAPAQSGATAADLPESTQLKQLKQWWHKASEADRERFQQWLDQTTGDAD